MIGENLHSKAEMKWVWAFSVTLMLLTLVPYLIGYQAQGGAWSYTGFLFGVEDGNSYIAKMMAGAYGSWLFKTPYSTMDQTGVLAFLPYIILGKLSTFTGIHEQLVAIYHWFRIAAGFLALWATYDFISFFVTTIRYRRLGLLFGSLGGGFGWLLLATNNSPWLGSIPLEFYSPESFGFLGLFGIPHLSLARAGLLWGLLYFLKAAQSSGKLSWKLSAISSGHWLVCAFAQPITAAILGFVILIYLMALTLLKLIKRDHCPPFNWNHYVSVALLAGLFPSIYLAYIFARFRVDPFLSHWTAQNIILSPHPFHYLVAYGVLLPCVVLGIVILLRKYLLPGLLPVLWIISIPVLIYLPFNLQRRLTEGIWIVIIIFSMVTLEHLANTQKKPLALASVLGMILTLPSTVILFMGSIYQVSQPLPPLFRHSPEIQAFEKIRDLASPNDIVLTSFQVGNALPAWAPVRVLIGHGPETVGLAELELQVKQFFSATASDSWRVAFINSHNIRYIFWSDAERELGAWLPGHVSYLSEEYSYDGIYIFATKINSGNPN